MKADIPKNIYEKYSGKKVAIVDGRVVAASDSIIISLNIAKKKFPHKKITLFSVMRQEDRPFLL
ncbi:hypothetical protein A2767_06840 [Candidatus Roizmanbacteria bacterium RIFCSPHIGHO2_01_FULL_35_10]|uniref:DUF5678 domain-containing protein n=1 Tax=Candidatus Roizmanbacteria bacterium RIFCSPLOWO2_01_FULL_35_13 TaxID=1802055 RepID=A0A1F7I7K6_9BACT|nr:MAG: hypothetical protein A2767_06840 [Candidatus Roizmanbacteria bacterium RIFCSPHIGHO2_01_FULL_35_10]OGK39348.1 MAG: hypothetical protein A3A74_05255 [Candidatus Roizmanbacteria bacterium RIFCSPLOWO2_01_FULL_35_13]